MSLLLEAVPNFSEGRDPATLQALSGALQTGATLLDVHADADHNRSVFTVVGERDGLIDALLAAVAGARDHIDLRRHEGAHPRIGAADVVPVVPLRARDMGHACEAASTLAARIGSELGLPVFVYGELRPGRGPAFFRRGGPPELAARIESGELIPDFGPARLDPAAGAVLVGARRPLIAFNVNVRGDPSVARELAALVRERDGGFPGVRALGLALPRAGLAQISMNVEDHETTPLHELVSLIEREAAARGAEVVGSELVGLVPAAAALSAAGLALRLTDFDATRVLELRLASMAAAQN